MPGRGRRGIRTPLGGCPPPDPSGRNGSQPVAPPSSANRSTSSTLSWMTLLIFQAGRQPSSMKRYRVRNVTPRCAEVSRVSNQPAVDEPSSEAITLEPWRCEPDQRVALTWPFAPENCEEFAGCIPRCTHPYYSDRTRCLNPSRLLSAESGHPDTFRPPQYPGRVPRLLLGSAPQHRPRRWADESCRQ